MKTFLYLLYKDLLLLIRDKAGLLLLFAMPLALVLIMTSMQDGIINVVTNTEVSLLLINDDKDSIGNAIEKERYCPKKCVNSKKYTFVNK